MRKTVLIITLVFLCAGVSFAQRQSTSARADAASTTSVRDDNQTVNLQSGTRLNAQLQQTLDARKLREGDTVVLKTTEAIKANGRTIVGKGARLIGHVTDVQQKSRANAESSISLVFDRLENGSLALPINARITSITQARTRAAYDDDGVLASDTGARNSTTTRSSSRQGSGGGGLLGGVAGTVGGVLDTTTQTTANVVGGTANAVGSTVGSAANTVGGIRITQSASVSAEGGSTLSLTGNNLHLEKGTSFRLVLNEAAGIGDN